MNERKLIKQIQKFQQIKPDKDWAVLCKQRVLADNGLKERDLQGSHWLAWQSQPFLFGSVGLVILVFIGILGIKFYQPVNPATFAEYENLAVSLRKLQGNLNNVTAELKAMTKANRMVEVKESVLATIEQGEQFLSSAKEKTEKLAPADEPKQEVLSALTEFETALTEMKETNEQIQQEVAEREIAELRESILSYEQKEILEQAEAYLEEGNYPQVLEKIIEISQIR